MSDIGGCPILCCLWRRRLEMAPLHRIVKRTSESVKRPSHLAPRREKEILSYESYEVRGPLHEIRFTLSDKLALERDG